VAVLDVDRRLLEVRRDVGEGGVEVELAGRVDHVDEVPSAA